MLEGKKVVLAYSGGLDTSVCVKWLEQQGAEPYALYLDLGQGEPSEDVKAKALQIGATDAFVRDAKAEFAGEYVAPAIKANALYGGKYPLFTALGRPLIAKKLVEVAQEVGATHIAHGSTGKGNDQVRFDVTTASIAPDLTVVAPVRDWNMSRPEEIAYAEEHGIPVPVTKKSPYSVDENLFGRSIEAGLVGIKSREIYECPAALTVIQAHKELETMTLTKDVIRFKATVEQRYAELTYDGLWFTPLKRALDTFVAETQRTVTGTVRLKLYKGSSTVVGRTAPRALYSKELATYDPNSTFDEGAAAGFIALWGLPARQWAGVNGGIEQSPA